ncbi:MAG: hypothetical protein ACREID_06805 [Planctomycetota bacterium]
MFLHVTTQIPGVPHDGLLSEKGGRGFPFLCVLDAKGDVVVEHDGPRTVQGFRETGGLAKRYVELKPKADGGDRSARIDFALLRARMGKLPLEECRKEISGLGDLTPEQRKTLDGLEADARVDEILKTSHAKAFLELRAEGKIPVSFQRRSSFWATLLGYAEYAKDAGLYGEALEELRALHGDDPGAARFLAQAEEKLTAMEREAERGASEEEER